MDGTYDAPRLLNIVLRGLMVSTLSTVQKIHGTNGTSFCDIEMRNLSICSLSMSLIPALMQCDILGYFRLVA